MSTRVNTIRAVAQRSRSRSISKESPIAVAQRSRSKSISGESSIADPTKDVEKSSTKPHKGTYLFRLCLIIFLSYCVFSYISGLHEEISDLKEISKILKYDYTELQIQMSTLKKLVSDMSDEKIKLDEDRDMFRKHWEEEKKKFQKLRAVCGTGYFCFIFSRLSDYSLIINLLSSSENEPEPDSEAFGASEASDEASRHCWVSGPEIFTLTNNLHVSLVLVLKLYESELYESLY